MDMKYDSLLQRLERERIRNQMTQNELSKKIGMIQSHYCKAEKGHNFFGFNALCKMCNTNLNVYYIFTGRDCVDRYDSLLATASFEQLLLCVQYIHMIAKENQENIEWSVIYMYTKYIEFTGWAIGFEKNIFKSTRMYLGEKQSDMAHKLGVDIKKLRALEIRDLPPNSQIIFDMYNLFGISPSLFLRNKRCLQNEISCLIDIGDKEIRQRIISIIEFTLVNI